MCARSLCLWPRVAALVLAASSGCQFDYPRAIEDGEVRLTVLGPDGAPAPTALASIPGTPRVAAAGPEGVIALRGLPAIAGVVRVVVDDDGDGVPSAGTLVPFQTTLAPVRKNLSDGITTEAKTVVTGLLLGEHRLQKTGALTGVVREGGAVLAAGRSAFVVVLRSSLVGMGAGAREATLPVEAAAAAAADGSFTVDGVIPGTVTVVALVRSGTDEPDVAGLLEASVSDDAPLIVDATTPLPRTAPMQLELVGGGERATVQNIFFLRPGTLTDLVPPLAVDEPAGVHVIDAPIALFDLGVQVSDGPGTTIPGLIAVNADLPPWLPVELPAVEDACVVDGARDCDRDGLRGVRPGADADALYDACVPACAALVGADLDGASCETADGSFDCDDDADGVPDAVERSCVLPHQGTDADGDGLCEPGADLFPRCADNTPENC